MIFEQVVKPMTFEQDQRVRIIAPSPITGNGKVVGISHTPLPVLGPFYMVQLDDPSKIHQMDYPYNTIVVPEIHLVALGKSEEKEPEPMNSVEIVESMEGLHHEIQEWLNREEAACPSLSERIVKIRKAVNDFMDKFEPMMDNLKNNAFSVATGLPVQLEKEEWNDISVS